MSHTIPFLFAAPLRPRWLLLLLLSPLYCTGTRHLLSFFLITLPARSLLQITEPEPERCRSIKQGLSRSELIYHARILRNSASASTVVRLRCMHRCR
jgi:hypothetical protein